jgi:hypothetical protein
MSAPLVLADKVHVRGATRWHGAVARRRQIGHLARPAAQVALSSREPASGGPRLNWRTYTRRMKPNPPYLATVVVAVLIMVMGLSLEGSLFSLSTLNQVLGDALAVVGVRATQEVARILIIASPTLLIIGSLVRGI